MLNHVVFVANQNVSVLIKILTLIYSVAMHKLTLNHVNEKEGFRILLANRASAKQILLAQQEIHWPRASGPVLISTPEIDSVLKPKKFNFRLIVAVVKNSLI